MNKLSLFEYDQKQREANHATFIAGFDEAGRGPLAGPVSTAGVVLPPDYQNPLINDSKKLTDRERRKLFNEIKKVALAYYVCLVPVETIDTINILEADRLGMETCLTEMLKTQKIDYIITDYMSLHTDIPLLSIPKGDATSLSVAAASILAKVSRDDYMILLDKQYPIYQFAKNKGYGTKAHIDAIEKYGYVAGVHRLTFEPVKSMYLGVEQLKLF
ncbi:MAG: ribonuclease HII [Bacilli bacterium]|nr:ribonuclease HII [Bacilli bacterium]